jgi:sec-independent protein translocase protein TatA
MNFAGIGPAELLLILIIALLIFGPAKLPQVAKDLGDTIQRWRQALEDISEDVGVQTPISPKREAEIQATIQKVAKVRHTEGSHEVTTRSDDEANAAEEQKEETEVETECQT